MYLFNINTNNFYYILYYLSGFICPAFVCFNSINIFTYYKFNESNNNIKKIIKGKTLLFIVLLSLVSLSFLSVNYIFTTIVLFINLFFDVNFFSNLKDVNLIYFAMLFCILLITNQSRIFIKKFILANFFVFSFVTWHSSINGLLLNKKFIFNDYLPLDNVNLINIIYLCTFDLLFYIWSFISYKDKLSDWRIKLPTNKEFLAIYKIVVFYSIYKIS